MSICQFSKTDEDSGVNMDVSIFGLGYVGAVSAACLSKQGHHVIGVDPVDIKVETINQGQAPIIEAELGGIIKEAVESHRLKATSSATEAIEKTQLSFVCVGTPSQANGNLDTRYIQRVCEHIGSAIKHKASRHVVVIRSTILPGTIKNTVIPTLEASSKKIAGQDFGVCSNPEFLREGTAVHDFYHPPKTVIGETDKTSGDLLASLYEDIDAPMIRTDIEVAEMIKYVDNTWHALKVAFGNEMGNVCKALGIDSHKVMDIFCKDTKLNISSNYLTPGFAFGGSCLPKDVSAIAYKSKLLDMNLPILNAILPSNKIHIENGLHMIMEAGNKKIGVLGFSFKAGTDDLRESPVVEIVERLLGKGYEIKLYDKNVNLASLLGANKNFIMNRIPHIAKLMVKSIEEVLDHAQTIVIGNRSSEFKNLFHLLEDDQIIIDLVRAIQGQISSEKYKGICW